MHLGWTRVYVAYVHDLNLLRHVEDAAIPTASRNAGFDIFGLDGNMVEILESREFIV